MHGQMDLAKMLFRTLFQIELKTLQKKKDIAKHMFLVVNKISEFCTRSV